ncbi:MAG: glycoside hydrolase family 28 protein [Verrucomicrobia bacterium]|nr:glycoside hydrolase family 28 protein [Verrucomicrobiota bacterium]
MSLRMRLLLPLLLLFVPVLRAGEPVVPAAVGDGTTLNTVVLQKAIDTCSAQGGGRVRLPAGRYLTGTLQLKDNVILHLDEQAVLLGSTRAADYRNLDPFTAGDGVKDLGYALIVAVDAQHVGIEGPGTIDGQGKAVKAAQNPYTVRPFLIRWVRCSDITVRETHLTGPGAWTMHFFQCRNVAVDGVTIRSLGLVNNDGIDIDSCETVRITGCDIDSGDDALCLKATSPRPCHDIVATGCRLKTVCNAIKLGTESLGDFENIRISDCQIRDTGMAGIALYSVDGAHLQNVTMDGITMDGVSVPISVRLGARLKTFRPGDQPRPPGALRDITLRHIHATGARLIGLLINGIPGHPVESLALDDIQIELVGGGKAADTAVQLPEKISAYPEMSMFGRNMPAYALYFRHVDGISLRNVHTNVTLPDTRPAGVFIDVVNMTPADFSGASVVGKMAP